MHPRDLWNALRSDEGIDFALQTLSRFREPGKLFQEVLNNTRTAIMEYERATPPWITQKGVDNLKYLADKWMETFSARLSPADKEHLAPYMKTISYGIQDSFDRLEKD